MQWEKLVIYSLSLYSVSHSEWVRGIRPVMSTPAANYKWSKIILSNLAKDPYLHHWKIGATSYPTKGERCSSSFFSTRLFLLLYGEGFFIFWFCFYFLFMTEKKQKVLLLVYSFSILFPTCFLKLQNTETLQFSRKLRRQKIKTHKRKEAK